MNGPKSTGAHPFKTVGLVATQQVLRSLRNVPPPLFSRSSAHSGRPNGRLAGRMLTTSLGVSASHHGGGVNPPKLIMHLFFNCACPFNRAPPVPQSDTTSSMHPPHFHGKSEGISIFGPDYCPNNYAPPGRPSDVPSIMHLQTYWGGGAGRMRDAPKITRQQIAP